MNSQDLFFLRGLGFPFTGLGKTLELVKSKAHQLIGRDAKLTFILLVVLGLDVVLEVVIREGLVSAKELDKQVGGVFTPSVELDGNVLDVLVEVFDVVINLLDVFLEVVELDAEDRQMEPQFLRLSR